VVLAALLGAGAAALLIRWLGRDHRQGREEVVSGWLGQPSRRLLNDILGRANVLLWWGKVRREGDTFHWTIEVPPELQGRPLLQLARSTGSGGLWSEQQVPELREMTQRAEEALARGDPSYRHRFRVETSEGVQWLSEEVTVESQGENQWALWGVIIDITAQQEAEAARRATETRLQHILNRADCLLWQARVVRRPEGNFVWRVHFAPSILQEKVFGRKIGPEEMNVFDGLEVPDAAEMHARSARALESGASGYEQEYPVIRDGRLTWLSEQVSIVAVGPLTWDLVGVAIDVTARHEAEAARRASEVRLAHLLSRADCLVWQARVVEQSDGQLYWSDMEVIRSGMEERLFGAAGKARCLIWPPENVPDLAEMDRRSSAAMRDGMSGYEQEFPFVRDGTALWLHEHVTIVPEAPGRWSLVGVVTDLTERRRMKEDLQRASRLEAVGFLAGGIAHDFNNVLTAVMGNLAVAALDRDLSEDVRYSLAEAERACVKARDLTQQLLTFAKGGAPIRGVVHLPDTIRESAHIALHGFRVRCEYEWPADLGPVHADRAQVGQIIQNLVLNAAQAMAEGGTIRIQATNCTVTAAETVPLPPGEYVQISIRDEGPGISAADQARLFDPYFTTKKLGHGLGLATVYSIIKRHEGHVSVESVPGSGALFRVWLPAHHGPVAPRAVETAREQPMLQGRLLVMDDEAAVRGAVAKLAQRLGFVVEEAATGEEAVACFRRALVAGKPFDLVMMDLIVPGHMGGAEAVRQIRELQPDIKTIVSSGYSSDPVMAHHREHGFDGVVAKPYNFREFELVVREVLEDSTAK
jgi:signal transduction histidine kinase/ActR/RegA family two-component response regulator